MAGTSGLQCRGHYDCRGFAGRTEVTGIEEGDGPRPCRRKAGLGTLNFWKDGGLLRRHIMMERRQRTLIPESVR